MRSRTPPSFAAQPWRSLVILCLYGYQGLVAGFAFNAIPNLHASLGATPGAIGAYVALVGLPWTLQPLWGPVVDRFGGSRLGRRRPWVLAGLGGALVSLALLPMAGEGPGSLALLGPLLCLHSVFAALLDTAADGMIMDRVPDHRLGQATAHTRMGFALGSAAGAAIFAWLLPALGLPRAALVLLALGAATGALALLVREAPPGEPAAQPPPAGQGFGALLRALGAALLRREALALLGFCIVVEFAVGAFGVSLSVAMVQAGGWDPAALSRLQGLLALVGGTVGAATIGWWSDRAGHGRVLVALLLLCCAAHLVAALLLRGGPPSGAAAAVALALSGIAPALFFVALAPGVMMTSRGAAAATRFALFMAALNLGGVAGAAASGPVAGALGLWQMALGAATVFALCAAAAARPGIVFART